MRASERAWRRRAARLSYYATASLSLSAARRSTELFNEAWLSHNVFCSWMSLSLGLEFLFFFHGHLFFFTPPLHSLLFGHQSGKGVATKEPLEILEVCQSDSIFFFLNGKLVKQQQVKAKHCVTRGLWCVAVENEAMNQSCRHVSVLMSHINC